jgi:hypothetical protein
MNLSTVKRLAIVVVLLLGSRRAGPVYAGTRPRKATTSRAAHERTPRHQAAKRSFERATGFPHGRPGYVVDHVVPLACGGADVPSNMQWQTIAESKAKDKVERKGPGCR